MDLLVLTSLNQVRKIFSFFRKEATFMRRSTVLCLPSQFVFPDLMDMRVTGCTWTCRSVEDQV
jgi:hypothetical protein